jgi:hypothetical protein
MIDYLMYLFAEDVGLGWYTLIVALFSAGLGCLATLLISYRRGDQ